jgi:hypothetical protein
MAKVISSSLLIEWEADGGASELFRRTWLSGNGILYTSQILGSLPHNPLDQWI